MDEELSKHSGRKKLRLEVWDGLITVAFVLVVVVASQTLQPAPIINNTFLAVGLAVFWAVRQLQVYTEDD